MEAFISHLWKSTIIITIFYGFYKLLLQHETFFRSIRFFMLIGILLSIALPSITILKYVEIAPINVVATNTTSILTPTEDSATDWTFIGFVLYLLVCSGLLIKFTIQLISIATLINRSSYTKINGFYLVATNSKVSPFSFFNFVVYNPTQFRQAELTQVLAHEKAHVQQMHSIDNLLANLLVILCWFNPFAWFYKKSILQNLEFIADEYAQQVTESQHSYQQLLLKTTVPNYQMALANNFYKSLLKKRIIMLHKQRSSYKSQWKFTGIVPLLFIYLLTFNTETVAQQKSKAKKIITVNADVFAMVLDKHSTKDALKKISDRFSEESLVVKFSNVKRNSANEITAIKINTKANNGKVAASHASNLEQGINPIQISYDKDNNTLNIGSEGEHHLDGYTYSTKGKGDSFVFISNDDEEGDKNVWVTKKGSNKITVESHYDEDEDENHTEDVIKITTKKGGKKTKTMAFSSSDDTNPLIILDGKEITKKEMEALDTDTIKSVDVSKGPKAIKKYGKKAKDGVIIITSK